MNNISDELINEIVEYCFNDETLKEAGVLEFGADYIFVSRKELANSIKQAINKKESK